MKRFLPIVPIIFLLLINSCGVYVPEEIPAPLWTSMVQTQTATVWTPTYTPTHDADESKIIGWLNETLLMADPLERTLDAKYQVVEIFFPTVPDSSLTVFRVDIRCICTFNPNCCTPERMFVITIGAMKNKAEKVIEDVPGSVHEVKVVCFDHSTQIGVMAASWMDVKDYLRNNINGSQLGARTYYSSLP